jgi:hypothetical protein
MPEPAVQPDQPISWRVVADGTPVHDVQGDVAGHVADVLGADAEDIFHGLVIKRAQGGHECVVLAERITAMTPALIETDLSASEILELPVYQAEQTFHLGITGLLRKHEGWIKGD